MKCCDNVDRVIHAQRCLRDKGQTFRIPHLHCGHIFDGFHQQNFAFGQLPHCADRFGVSFVTNHDHLQTIVVMTGRFDMNLAHQRTRRVNVDHLALGGLGGHGLGHAVG